MLSFFKYVRGIPKRIPIAYYPYKPYMHQHRCLFIHIPKNAGTSVLRAFGEESGRIHAKWYEYFESNRYFFNQYHKFAIVRDPVERLHSTYQYLVSGGNQATSDLSLTTLIKNNSNSFDSFVKEVLSEELLWLSPLFQPQAAYIVNTQKQLMVDSLLRYEQLEADWRELTTTLKCDFSLPHTNRSKAADSKTDLSEQGHEKIRHLYQLDYELFKY
jgi:hypothetical protein